MAESGRIRVGLVDDHKIVIEGLQLLLEDAVEVAFVFAATSGPEALRILHGTETDVVLLDIEMPGMDGITVCRMIRQQFPDVRIIALTMLNERSLIRQMVEAGADGYLLKNTSREELILAIERVHSGKSHYSPEIAEIIVRGNAHTNTGSEHSYPSLSSREKQIVSLILDEYTTSEIAEQLHISFNTVETHRRNIMHKLGAKNTAGIVRIVLENGLLDGSN